MKRYLLSLLIFLLPLMLTGCWEEELPEEGPGLIPLEEENEEGITAPLPSTFSLPYAPEQPLDPVTCPDGTQQVVGSLLFESLFQLDHQFTPQPLLCENFTYDAATYTYIFHLRAGVQFSDGSPLTGHDVSTTLLRAQKSARYSSRLSQVSSITATASDVIVTLYGPNTSFPALLDIPIIKSGTESSPIPLGTGPYLMDRTSPQLVINQLWWQGSGQPVDRIPLEEASDWDTTLYRFTSHEVQLISADLIGGKNPASATGSLTFQDADTTTLQFLGCNTRREPLNNPALRHALWMSFNRASVISAFLSGHGKAAQFPVSPVSTLYPEDLDIHYSQEEFSKALAQSGYHNSRPLNLLVNAENPFKVSVAEFIAQSMTKGGVTVTVSALPWEEYRKALDRGNFDLYYGEVRLTADWNLLPLLSTGGSLNYGGWADPMTDQLLTAYSAAQQPEAAMKSLCIHLRAQAPIIPVCFTSTSVLMHSNVIDGLTPTATQPFYNLTECKIHLQ